VSNLVSANEIRAQVSIVQDVMRKVMKDGTHYGVIPGCEKPTLYKAGSEVLLTTFQVSVKPVVEDLSTPDEARYRVYTEGTYRGDGSHVGTGIGECSSNEEKYKWRKAVCDEEWEETPENRRREKWFKGKWDKATRKMGESYKVKQVRTEIADVSNTVLKMAKKRSQIDLTLTSTAASDIFTQDIEDMPPEYQGMGEDVAPTKEQVQPPQPKNATPADVVDENIPNCEGCGVPIAKTMADAEKVIDWCNKKYGGVKLCRNCQSK